MKNTSGARFWTNAAAVAAGALFSVCHLQGAGDAVQSGGGGDYLHPETGMVLPFRLGDMEAVGSIIDYEQTQPGFGVSRNYSGPRAKASVYIYNLGMRQVGGEMEEELIGRALKMAEMEVESVGKMGIYSGVRAEGRGEANWGRGRVRRSPLSVYCFSQGDKNFRSYIYVTVFKNHFLKVRISQEKGGGERQRQKFLEDLGRQIPG